VRRRPFFQLAPCDSLKSQMFDLNHRVLDHLAARNDERRRDCGALSISTAPSSISCYRSAATKLQRSDFSSACLPRVLRHRARS